MDTYLILLLVLYVIGIIFVYSNVNKKIPKKYTEGFKGFILQLLIYSNPITCALLVLWYERDTTSGSFKYRLKTKNFGLLFGVSIMILSSVLFATKMMGNSSIYSSSSSVGFMKSSKSDNNEWDYKFVYMSGTVCNVFSPKTENVRFVIDQKLDKGSIDFELYNSSDSLITNLQSNQTIKLIPNEDYIVKAKVENASGRFVVKMLD